MRIKYHRETDRKKLVVAAAEQLGEKPVYAGAPMMNYIVGAYTVACDRTLTGPDDHDLVAALRQQGYEPMEETYDAEPAAPEEVETEQPDRMSVDMILVDYPAEAIDRLRKLVDSKAALLKICRREDWPMCDFTGKTDFPRKVLYQTEGHCPAGKEACA